MNETAAIPLHTGQILGLEFETRALRRPDGSSLTYCEFGAENGPVLLFSHGGGSCRLEAASGAAVARERGLRLIGYDRPGFGRSAPVPRPTLLSHSEDARFLLDELGIARCALAGVSAGGAISVALATALGDRVTHVFPINTSCQPSDPSWRAATFFSRLMIWTFRLGIARSMFEKIRRDPIGTLRASRYVSADDLAMFNDPRFGPFIDELMREGLRQGTDAIVNEVKLIYSQPWGFNWGSPTAPLTIFQGVEDSLHSVVHEAERQHPQVSVVSIPGGHFGGYRPEVWRELLTLMPH